MADPTPPATRTYEITFEDGAFRIEIPETWKVTYGPVVGADSKTSSHRLMAFRAWESETKQRVLFTGVTAFRDISLPLLVRAVRKYGTEEWYEDNGTWIKERAAEVEKRWVTIDEISERLPEETKDGDEDGWQPKSLSYPTAKNRLITTGRRA